MSTSAIVRDSGRPAERAPGAIASGVVDVRDAAHFDELLATHSRVAIDFSASWCGPCRKIGPVFHRLATEVPDVLFVTVDVDRNPDVHDRYTDPKDDDTRSIPRFVFVHDREAVEALTCSGSRCQQKLADSATALAKMSSRPRRSRPSHKSNHPSP